MYNKIVIGLDQSYTRTGIGIGVDGKLVKVTSEAFRGCKNKSEKRKRLSMVLRKIIQSNQHKSSEMVIICERIRTFSHHKGGNQDVDADEAKGAGQFISTNYIKATGGLIATIVDTAYEFGVHTFSVDTRAWKSKVLGTSKGSATGNKGNAIKFITNKGFDIGRADRNGKIVYDDDAADAGCITLYGFVPKDKQCLKKEE